MDHDDIKVLKDLVRNIRQSYEIAQARRHSAEVAVALMELQLSSMQTWVNTVKEWEDQSKFDLDEAKLKLKEAKNEARIQDESDD